jgi:hypothetical protein
MGVSEGDFGCSGDAPWQIAQAYFVSRLRARVETNRQQLIVAAVQSNRARMAAREAVWQARGVRARVLYEGLIARAGAAARRSALSAADEPTWRRGPL